MIAQTLPRLTGSRCQCSACGELFNSVSIFDRHRKGSWTGRPLTRRCLTIEEMNQRGWSKNSKGFWITQRSPYHSRRIDDHAVPYMEGAQRV